MDIKDLLDLHEKLESRINAYWTYWSVVIFAIGGWLFSANHHFSSHEATIMMVGVAVFFAANLGVLWPATCLVTGLRDEIRIKSGSIAFASEKLASAFAEDTLKSRLQLTVALHVVVDLVVIWALFNSSKPLVAAVTA